MRIIKSGLGIISGFILLLSGSCSDTPSTRTERLLKEWIGKEIVFPQDARFTVPAGGETAPFSEFDSYKVLAYIDSAGCVPCKLELPYWMQFMREAEEKSPEKIDLLLVIDTTPEKVARINRMIAHTGFPHPVWFDENGSLDRENAFPKESAFHFFLLDKNNRVLSVGNPLSNSRIWENYIRVAAGRNCR